MADTLGKAIDELLDNSEIQSTDVGQPGKYFEWHTPKSARVLQSRALQLYRTFHEHLTWVLDLHDPNAKQMHIYQTDFIREVIEQTAHTQISSITEAQTRVQRELSECIEAIEAIYDPMADQILLIPDTNVLMDYPNLGEYDFRIPQGWLILASTTLRELDNLKRDRDPRKHEAARKAIRKIKSVGDAGDTLEGVPLNPHLRLMVKVAEPREEELLDWLDLSHPDDRFIATALQVAREHPKASACIVSSDLNVINKGRVARFAVVDPEDYLAQREPTADSPV